MAKEISRKDFFTEIISSGLELFADISPFKSFERPPGAHPNDDLFKSLCTGCDLCMIACPVNVIMVEDMEKRYPVIYPEKDPCQQCADTPCITSCPTGALKNNEVNHGSR